MTQPYDSAVNGGKTQMKKKQWEPRTYKTTGYLNNIGTVTFDCGKRYIRVLSEKDYQRLLNLSKAQAIRRALK